MRLTALVCATYILPVLALAADIPPGGSIALSKNADGAFANAPSKHVSISGNGKHVSFATVASNLGPGTFNGFQQVFQGKRSGTSLGLASVSTLDGPANLDCSASMLSSNGRFIAFESESTLFVNGVVGGDNKVFRRDRETGEIVLASLTSTGAQVDTHARLADISPDGRFVVFISNSKNVVPGVATEFSRAYVRDLEKGTTVLASQNDDEVPLTNATYNARISANGRYVFFAAASPELEGFGKIGTYMRDLKKGRTKILSRNYLGETANASTYFLGVSENGRFVVMRTEATNLTSLMMGGVVLLDRSSNLIVPIAVSKPNLTVDLVGDDALVANDGSRVWLQVYYTGSMGTTEQYDLLEVDRAKKKLWTRISLEGYEPMSGFMEMDGSASAEWVAVVTDEPITDSTGLIDSNGQRDVYLLRAH